MTTVVKFQVCQSEMEIIPWKIIINLLENMQYFTLYLEIGTSAH